MDSDSPIETGQENAGTAAIPTADESTASAANPSLLSGGLGVVVALILLATAGYLSYQTLFTIEPEPLNPPRVIYICAETGKKFEHKPQVGETVPIMSPHSKKKTGYIAEKCYWTKDREQMLIPTYILLNEHRGIDGPTICPDCGELVVPHNPAPPIGTPIARTDKAKSKPKPPNTRS